MEISQENKVCVATTQLQEDSFSRERWGTRQKWEKRTVSYFTKCHKHAGNSSGRRGNHTTVCAHRPGTSGTPAQVPRIYYPELQLPFLRNTLGVSPPLLPSHHSSILLWCSPRITEMSQAASQWVRAQNRLFLCLKTSGHRHSTLDTADVRGTGKSAIGPINTSLQSQPII